MAFFLNTDNRELDVNKSYTTGFEIYEQAKKIKVYVVYNRPFIKIDSDILAPISNNECGLETIKSNTLDNISHLNYTLAEFSSLYWIWKNDMISDYVGCFHYRRYLSFERKEIYSTKLEDLKWDYNTASTLLTNYDLIIPPKFRMGINPYQQYCTHHEKLLLDKTIEIIKSKYPQEYIDSMNIAFNNDYGYFCNLFITKREIFNNFMQFVFDILEDLKPYLGTHSQSRALGFVGERLYNIYIHYLINYTNYRICEVPQIYISDDYNILINNSIESI